MLVIQPRTSNNRYEKLGSIGIWAFVGHCNEIGTIKPVFLWFKFILKVATPNGLSPCSITFRTTTLVDKSFDHSMEDEIIIIPFFT
jgi:hypothetical protein